MSFCRQFINSKQRKLKKIPIILIHFFFTRFNDLTKYRRLLKLGPPLKILDAKTFCQRYDGAKNNVNDERVGPIDKDVKFCSKNWVEATTNTDFP